MPSLLVIRLLPEKPVDAATFAGYLTGLKLTAGDASFGVPFPTDATPAFGSAAFLPPTGFPVNDTAGDPTPVADPGTSITQHFKISNPAPLILHRDMWSVATAMIVIPDLPDPPAMPNGEHLTVDVRLQVMRGAMRLNYNEIYYNVATDTALNALPADRSTLPFISSVISFYLYLPPPNQQPGNGTTSTGNTAAPEFSGLKTSIQKVLTDEGAIASITDLTLDQARHVAYEIIWDTTVFPLPQPAEILEDLYTDPTSSGSDQQQNRQQFEGDLTTYFVQHNADAERLANYVFSASAALWAEQQATLAISAGFYFPVLLNTPSNEVRLHLTNQAGGALNPPFIVPAEYFYALGSILPAQVDRQQRYNLATMDAEDHTLASLSGAINDGVIIEPAINRFQAVRRLKALGLATDTSVPVCPIQAGTAEAGLISDWLLFSTQDIAVFWAGLVLPNPDVTGHMHLLVWAIARGFTNLVTAIEAPAFGITTATDLTLKTSQNWTDLLSTAPPSLLPPFTAPGSLQERIQAFLISLRKFFDLINTAPANPVPLSFLPDSLDISDNRLSFFLDRYKTDSGVDYIFAGGNIAAMVTQAIGETFPGDPQQQQQFAAWLNCIQGLIALVAGIVPPALQFSVMEALWARGFISPDRIEGFSLADFTKALSGSVAYDFAALIFGNAGAVDPIPPPGPGGFIPVNPDGELVDCLPPETLSPFGHIAYLHELLEVSVDSTCQNPLPGTNPTLASVLSARRGDLGGLLSSVSNLDTPIPLIDLVNESLENMAATATSVGAVYNTTTTIPVCVPEHSTPAIPTALPVAWDKLRNDFSTCDLPYSQPLDLSATYLGAMKTNRFETKRRFREMICEFVLDPENPPAGFPAHLWRYPVRLDIGLDYLGLHPEEYALLFQNHIVTDDTVAPAAGEQSLYTLYGFTTATIGGKNWKDIVVALPEFLARTCLGYCEFLALWKCGIVSFHAKDQKDGFPDCEPCCLDPYIIVFDNPADPATALKELIIFIRLWRLLRHLPGARYSMDELSDIAVVFQLFTAGTVNEDFIRQLIAFQLLRDEYGLPLHQEQPAAAGLTGALRTQILALWATGVPPDLYEWAVGELLRQVDQLGVNRHHAPKRGPEFMKILEDNLDPLSILAGFNPQPPGPGGASWQSLPSHTLRFTEILVKIYTSNFGIGELLFLFTASDHLGGDDPFPLPTPEESEDRCFDLPDDEWEVSLVALREKLLKVEAGEEEARTWSWDKMGRTLEKEAGMASAATDIRWLTLGRQFFPGILSRSGIHVTPLQTQFRAPLPLAAPTAPLMWNTPGEGPFRYDNATQELYASLPLNDEAVLAKISRIRQLNATEQQAVQDLYFQPRATLAAFDFLFPDRRTADLFLIQEGDEDRRWSWFQRSFAIFYQRCRLMAEHLSGHIDEATTTHSEEGQAAARFLLRQLWADENKATTDWENDNGQPPVLTWGPKPQGAAFTALLGLAGTGLLAQYSNEAGAVCWRGVQEDGFFFGHARNGVNAPLPVVIPGLPASTITNAFAQIRNGFLLADHDGRMLGGAEGFSLEANGLLSIGHEGMYSFSAGLPGREGEMPDVEGAKHCHHWRITLTRGQKSWVLLSHRWPDTDLSGASSSPQLLKRGFYQLQIELVRSPFSFEEMDDVCPQLTGFELRYRGPDAGDCWRCIPRDRLFIARKESTLAEGLSVKDPAALGFLTGQYIPTIRDIRRTYQRVFKALLFTRRLSLSVKEISDDGQSELGYMLAHGDLFAGRSYTSTGPGTYSTHLANFLFDFLPVTDPYESPAAAQDHRSAPSVRRQQALFDTWERLFDYTLMRRSVDRHAEKPVWLLFHESAELHVDPMAQMVRYLGIDIRHDNLVLRYCQDRAIVSADLEDERWPIRIWHADRWIKSLQHQFFEKDITICRPDLWSADDPSVIGAGETESGNANLVRFYQDGCIRQGEPRRFAEIKQLNDDLRLRGRAALLAYLTHQNRVLLPGGTPVTTILQLSEVLLQDVLAGVCEKASRIEEAITVVQSFIRRARLGIEPGWTLPPAFIAVWDTHFACYKTWEACKRREIYAENWVEWDDLKTARRSETYQFLESELRQATLTIPVPGGMTWWSGARPPVHPGLQLLQEREPSVIRLLNPVPEGLGLLGTPDRHARPSWLAPMLGVPVNQIPGNGPIPGDGQPNGNGDGNVILLHEFDAAPGAVAPGAAAPPAPDISADLPFWLQAAMRLGVHFIRIAAAGIPPATTHFSPACATGKSSGCCCECGKEHPPLMDEYYFWIEPSGYFLEPEQEADWGISAADGESDWHKKAALPGLLDWSALPMVRLRWCRVHNGEFQAPRWSDEGAEIDTSLVGGVTVAANPVLVFTGRTGDQLNFQITNTHASWGEPAITPAGFQYGLAADQALVIPLVHPPALPAPVGGLAAFPFFAWFVPGAPLLPPSLFSPALAVAWHLRTHCHFEAALKWYELYYQPFINDNQWIHCLPAKGNDGQDIPGVNIHAPNGADPANPNGANPNPNAVNPNAANPNPNGPPAANFPPPAPACCCASDPVAIAVQKNRSILMLYLETLLQWGDASLRKNTPEAFQQARLLYDTATKILGRRPATIQATLTAAPLAVSAFKPACAPVNPRLVCLYNHAADRLELIHHCLNARRLHNGVPDLDMPYFGNSDIRECWKTRTVACSGNEDWCAPQSPYRFSFLIQRALDIAADVRSMGANLLAAFEKGDAEYLAAMRANQEQQLLQLGIEVRQQQWRAADWSVQALQKTKEMAQANLHYYKDLITNGLINGETQNDSLVTTSNTLRSAGNIVDAIGQVMNLIPNVFVGTSDFTELPIGTKLSAFFAASAKISEMVGEIVSTVASLGLTNANWTRRAQEWQHQVDIFTIEVDQAERQILAADRQRDSSLRELNNQEQQLEQSEAVQDFLRDKFTNHELYLWMQHETAALLYKLFELALHCGRQAERAFNFERGHLSREFITGELFDNLHEGLLCGDRLHAALRRMEKAYYDENARERELTKHFSLRLHFPIAFLELKLRGYCEIELPEWMYDLDYPGHYMRRIKNVSMTIPCVVGPYTGVHCRLTQLSSRTRVSPLLVPPAHGCCDAQRDRSGYDVPPDDPRVVCLYSATDAIATSGGQNDTGLFELNFRDERYLPFEFTGAISRWRIELPRENNFFDFESLSDLLLHVNYTAREGGALLRQAANLHVQDRLPGAGIRLLDLRQDMPDAWPVFEQQRTDCPEPRYLGVRVHRGMFPFLHPGGQFELLRVEVLFNAPEAEPDHHHILEFFESISPREAMRKDCDCEAHPIACVAHQHWPGYFHGIVDLHHPHLLRKEGAELGTLRFPESVGRIRQMVLLCYYRLVPEQGPASDHGFTPERRVMENPRFLSTKNEPK